MENSMNMIKLADEALTRMGLGERLVRPIIRRHFRWSPLVAILLAIMAVVIHFSALPGYWRGMAWLMMLLAFNQALFITVFGPLRRVGLDELPKDEHERLIAMRANLFSLRAVSAATFAGLIYMAVGSIRQWEMPSTFFDWAILSVLLFTIRLSLVVIHVSWATSPLADEEQAV